MSLNDVMIGAFQRIFLKVAFFFHRSGAWLDFYMPCASPTFNLIAKESAFAPPPSDERGGIPCLARVTHRGDTGSYNTKATMASIFQAGPEDRSSSCPTSQEPVQSVPHLFQMAGAALSMIGSPQAIPPRGITTDQSGSPRDPRSQSERRRRVSIQTPPAPDDPPEAQIPVPFGGRPFLPRSASAEPQLPPGDYSVLESRQDPHQQGRSTYYGR